MTKTIETVARGYAKSLRDAYKKKITYRESLHRAARDLFGFNNWEELIPRKDESYVVIKPSPLRFVLDGDSVGEFGVQGAWTFGTNISEANHNFSSEI